MICAKLVFLGKSIVYIEEIRYIGCKRYMENIYIIHYIISGVTPCYMISYVSVTSGVYIIVTSCGAWVPYFEPRCDLPDRPFHHGPPRPRERPGEEA